MLLTWRWRPAIELNPTQPKAGAMMKSKTPSLLSVISHNTRKKKNRKKKMRVWVKGSEDTKKKTRRRRRKSATTMDNGQQRCVHFHLPAAISNTSWTALTWTLLARCCCPILPNLIGLGACLAWTLAVGLALTTLFDAALNIFFPFSSYSSWFGISKNWHLSPRARTPFAFGSNPKSQRRSLSLLLSSSLFSSSLFSLLSTSACWLDKRRENFQIISETLTPVLQFWRKKTQN